MNTNSQYQDLKSYGLRITPIRKQLVDLLRGTDLPITVSEILAYIKANKTTIYREITSLLARGFLIEINFGDRAKRYELADRGHHHHLVCISCKSITDIQLSDDFKKEEKHIEVKENFKVQRHNLEFFGTCQNCTK